MNTSRFLTPTISVLLIAGAFSAWTVAVQDSDVELPNDFVAGTPARASEVNENFRALVDGIAASGIRIDELDARFEQLPRPKNQLLVATDGTDFQSVAAALDSITDASADNPYAVFVAPGVYVESTAVVMKPFVELIGAGSIATTLRRSAGADELSNDSAVLRLADQSVLRSLGIHNDATSGNFSVGVIGAGLGRDAALEDVRVRVDGVGGGSHFGIYVEDSDLRVRRSDVLVAGASSANAAFVSTLVNDGSAQPRLLDSVFEADNPAIGVAVDLRGNSASIDGCDLLGDFRGIFVRDTGVTTVRDCRIQTVANPVMQQSSAATLLLGSTYFIGFDPVGNSNFFKYAHCIKPNFDPVDDGLGSSIQ